MFLLFVLIGFVPFVFGIAMNWFMMTFPNLLPPYFLVGIGMLLFWFAATYFSKPYAVSGSQLLCGIHLVPFAILVLLFVQEIILGAYWRNFIGMWTQLYYLPLVNLGFQMTFWSHRIFTAYMASFLLMLIAALVGCCLKQKKK